MATLFASGKFQATDATGPLAGALLYTYSAGTLNALATYTTQAGSSPNTNPVTCDANGQADVWVGSSSYRMILKTAAGVTVWDVDNITNGDFSSTASAGAGAGLVGISDALTYAAGTVGGKLNNLIFVTDTPYNAVAGDSTDCLAAFQAAYTACVASGKTLVIPAGTYKLTGSWTIAASDFRCIPLGNVTLHFTNSGQGLIIDGGASSGNLYNVVFGGFGPIKLKGNAATTDICFLRSVHHSNINIACKDGVTGCRVNFAVASKIAVECSVNTGAFVLTPTSGIVLDIRGSTENVADCDIYPIIEGVSGTGIVGTNASFNRIYGGTSEANNKGLTWAAASYLNQVYGTDFESNTTSDIEDAGNKNSYHGVRSASGAGNVILSGNGANFHGGYLRQAATTGSTLSAYYGTDFSDNGGLGITGTGTIAARVGCTRSNTSNVVTAKYSDLTGETGQTWTPALASAGGGAQGTVTTAVGTYAVVGKLCYVQANISIAKGTLGAGAISVTGLPIQARNTTSDVQYLPAGEWSTITLGAGYTHLALAIAVNGTTASLVKSGTAVASASVLVADCPDPVVLKFSGVYETV